MLDHSFESQIKVLLQSSDRFNAFKTLSGMNSNSLVTFLMALVNSRSTGTSATELLSSYSKSKFVKPSNISAKWRCYTHSNSKSLKVIFRNGYNYIPPGVLLCKSIPVPLFSDFLNWNRYMS
jgi:hypothetical protein